MTPDPEKPKADAKTKINALKAKWMPLWTAAEKRLKPYWEQGVTFYSARTAREKIMVLVLAGTTALFFDYWLLVRPVSSLFSETLPRVKVLRNERDTLRADKKNEDAIHAELVATRAKLQAKDARFTAPNGLPRLLENLSGLARGSGVRIVALSPMSTREAGTSRRYVGTPIRLSAMAGAHELGRFLAELENAETFFGVTKLDIRANSLDEKKHFVELEIMVFRRTA